MNVDDETKRLRRAEIRAIRALRLALTALLDASGDIVDNFAGDPGHNEPVEIEQARVRSWNVVRPLLIMAARSIEAFAKSGNLGTENTITTIKQCEDTLKLMEQDSAAKCLEPYLERLRADPKNEILLLQAILHGDKPEKPFEASGPVEDEGTARGETN